jgi:hypothetical protein
METILLVDTEFVGFVKPFIYDLSYIIAKKKGNEYVEIKSVGNVVKQVYQNRMLFETAYYSNKRPLYTKALRSKEYQKQNLKDIMVELKKDIADYNVDCVMGYNVSADKKSISFTSDYIKVENALKDLTFIDLMPIVVDNICDTDDYKTFAKDNNLITEKGYYKMSVESVSKFIYNNAEFVENHLGKDDNKHELKLLNYVLGIGGKVEALPKRFLKVR